MDKEEKQILTALNIHIGGIESAIWSIENMVQEYMELMRELKDKNDRRELET